MPTVRKANHPGSLQSDWYTRRGKLTKKAARYLQQRTSEHYAYIRKHSQRVA